MVLASEWIDYFIAQTSSALTRDTVRNFTNIAQNKILGMDTDFMRVLPDPYFMTVDQTYRYVANDSVRSSVERLPGALVGDIRSIKYVYTRNQGGWPQYQNWNNWTQRTPLRIIPDELGGYIEMPVTCPQSRKAMANDCILTWDTGYNPGESVFDGQPPYRARAYLWPQQLLSENQEITIPDDFIFDLLFETVSALVERPAYGSAPYPLAAASEAMKRFRDQYAASDTYSRPRNSPAINC